MAAQRRKTIVREWLNNLPTLKRKSKRTPHDVTAVGGGGGVDGGICSSSYFTNLISKVLWADRGRRRIDSMTASFHLGNQRSAL